MLQVDFQTFDLPFEYPFQISKGLKTHQPTLVIFLGMGAQFGLGEATEILYYNNTIRHMVDILEGKLPMIRRYAFNGPERFWHFLHHLIPGEHFLISALDCASWDMWSRLQGKSVYEMLGYTWGRNIPTDYTLGISTREELLEKIRKHKYPIYKLKVNGEQDMVLLRTVLEETNALVRIDANEGWTKSYFEEIRPMLDRNRIEFIEQPFHREDTDAIHYYREQTSIPLIADEAITDLQSLKSQIGLYDGANIKLSKCGGITPALSMIELLQKEDKKILLGCMSESRIGAAALAQLLPVADYADIDGPLLLSENIGSPVLYDDKGYITLPGDKGIGISWEGPGR